MQQVCSELEKEKDTDSDSTKKERFDTVLNLMHKVSTKKTLIFSP